MKIALVTPTRGDRPDFIEHCKKLANKQTLKPTQHIIVDYKPKSSKKDITERFKWGIEKATREGMACAVLWEDDDWYHPNYLSWLIKEWKKAGTPPVFGVGETYYYNIKIGSRLHMPHPGRTSAFCTILKLPYKLGWPKDHDPYFDMFLHKTGKVKTVPFPKDKIYAIGIKHGIGLFGGGGHGARFKWDMINKPARDWFVKNMDEEINFYDKIAKKSPTPTKSPYQNYKQINESSKKKKIIVRGPSARIRRRNR